MNNNNCEHSIWCENCGELTPYKLSLYSGITIDVCQVCGYRYTIHGVIKNRSKIIPSKTILDVVGITFIIFFVFLVYLSVFISIDFLFVIPPFIIVGLSLLDFLYMDFLSYVDIY